MSVCSSSLLSWNQVVMFLVTSHVNSYSIVRGTVLSGPRLDYVRLLRAPNRQAGLASFYFQRSVSTDVFFISLLPIDYTLL